MREMDFGNNLRRLALRFPKAAEKAVALAGMRVLRDAVMQAPTVPIDEGTLRGSGSVHVNGLLRHTSESMAHGGEPSPVRASLPTKGGKDVVTATIGFNTPYAAWLHENRDYEPHEPGSGPKYLEAAMDGPTLQKIIGNHLRQALASVNRGR